MLDAVFSFLCALAFTHILDMSETGQFGYNIGAVILFVADIYLLKRYAERQNRRLKVTAAFGGVLLGMCIVYGSYAYYVNDIFLSLGEGILQIGLILAVSALTVPLAAELLCALDKLNTWAGSKTEKETVITYKHFLLFWLVIIVAYLPLFLAWWPGNFIWDAPSQLRCVVNNYYTTHHPLAHTLLMGGAYNLGRSVGNAAWGFQFYTLLQMLILSSSFAYAVYYSKKKGLPKIVYRGLLVWFAFFPMHALYAITATKDVLCAAFFIYFMIFIIRLVIDREKFSAVSYIGMIVSGTLFALFRNNAIYAIIVAGILFVLFLRDRKAKFRITGIFIGIFVFSQGTNQILVSATNAVTLGAYRETLCMPLQCLARVGNQRTEEIAPEIYEEILMYIDEEAIVNYSPYSSDGVKGGSDEQLLKNNTLNFLKLCLKVGLQFPDEYLETFISNTLGYWYPLDRGTYISMDIALYHMLITAGDEIVKECYCDWAWDIYYNLFCVTNYHQVPVLGYLFRSVPYIWGLVAFMLWCIYRKRYRELAPAAVMFLYLMTCLLGPVVATRYVYCVMAGVPVLLSVICLSREKTPDATGEATHNIQQ